MNRTSEKPLRIGIVANEASGDQLGAGLIRAIRARRPDASFEGVAGPLMQRQGCATRLPMERLSVMGLVEVLRHLPELLRIRRQLAEHFLACPPDLFIGVDAPDFNLGLERRLRQAGIPTVHYVSPTVWAWRSGRVKAIRRSVDLMLSIFPFEVDFLRQHRVPVRYVGHPLAEEIPLEVDRQAARQALGLPADVTVLALLPGSRVSEMERLGQVFLETARWCAERRPGLHIVTPLVNRRLRAMFEAMVDEHAADLPIHLIDGRSREVLAAADLVLTASGTATLEALLHKRPMVVGYRVNPLTYWIAKTFKLLKIPHVAMANLLAGEALAPEYLQQQCQAPILGAALLSLLDDPQRVAAIQARYHAIHRQIRRASAAEAADAVLELLQQKGSRCN